MLYYEESYAAYIFDAETSNVKLPSLSTTSMKKCIWTIYEQERKFFFLKNVFPNNNIFDLYKIRIFVVYNISFKYVF